MKIPKRLKPLVEDGLIDEVRSRLMSGKEADVYVVRCGDEIRCAKVYKEPEQRGFKKAVQYQEGRKVRNSRRARAMEKGSKFGRQQQEDIWQTAEVDALNRVANAGVRVPTPYLCLEGVLLMELITDADGEVAPRLSEVLLTEEEAMAHHDQLMHDVKRMLSVGLVHGDLSEFNVLVDEHGPVIIDLPQAVDAAANNNAEAMLARDVNNMTRHYAQFAPSLGNSKFHKEMWALFETGDLQLDTPLSGTFAESAEAPDVAGVLEEIETVYEEEMERRAPEFESEEPRY